MKVKVIQSCLTLCYSVDYTVHEILQARILEWVAFPFFRGYSQHKGSNSGLPYCKQILYQLSYQGSPKEEMVCSKSVWRSPSLVDKPCSEQWEQVKSLGRGARAPPLG